MNVWSCLTAYAMVTEKVHLVTLVTDPCRMHPTVLAQTVITIDKISNGRIILGIGAGEAINLKPYGIPYDNRVARLKESIQVMKGLWTYERFDYQGQYFKLSSAHLQIIPVQKPFPPIFISALSPNSRIIAASEGNGWVSLATSPKMIKEDL